MHTFKKYEPQINKNSQFDILRIIGTTFGEEIEVNVKGDLYCEETIKLSSATVNVSGNVFGDRYNCDIDLGTGTLNVDGDLKLTGTTTNLRVNQGILKVGGNYHKGEGTFNLGSGRVEVEGDYQDVRKSGGSYSNVKFIMENDDAYMLVKGNFTTYSASSNLGNITAGTLEIKGDFKADGGSAFPASGTHKVILSGTDVQTVNFGQSRSSYFNILINKNVNSSVDSKYYKYLFSEIPYILKIQTNTSKGTIAKILDSTNQNLVSDQINSLGELNKTGYRFNGWFLDDEYTIPLNSENDIIAGDITLYAEWDELMQVESVDH